MRLKKKAGVQLSKFRSVSAPMLTFFKRISNRPWCGHYTLIQFLCRKSLKFCIVLSCSSSSSRGLPQMFMPRVTLHGNDDECVSADCLFVIISDHCWYKNIDEMTYRAHACDFTTARGFEINKCTHKHTMHTFNFQLTQIERQNSDKSQKLIWMFSRDNLCVVFVLL